MVGGIAKGKQPRLIFRIEKRLFDRLVQDGLEVEDRIPEIDPILVSVVSERRSIAAKECALRREEAKRAKKLVVDPIADKAAFDLFIGKKKPKR